MPSFIERQREYEELSLFIGGPWDGKIKEEIRGRYYSVIETKPDHNPFHDSVTLTTFEYTAVDYYNTPKRRYRIFLAPGLNWSELKEATRAYIETECLSNSPPNLLENYSPAPSPTTDSPSRPISPSKMDRSRLLDEIRYRIMAHYSTPPSGWPVKPEKFSTQSKKPGPTASPSTNQTSSKNSGTQSSTGSQPAWRQEFIRKRLLTKW